MSTPGISKSNYQPFESRASEAGRQTLSVDSISGPTGRTEVTGFRSMPVIKPNLPKNLQRYQVNQTEIPPTEQSDYANPILRQQADQAISKLHRPASTDQSANLELSSSGLINYSLPSGGYRAFNLGQLDRSLGLNQNLANARILHSDNSTGIFVYESPISSGSANATEVCLNIKALNDFCNSQISIEIKKSPGSSLGPNEVKHAIKTISDSLVNALMTRDSDQINKLLNQLEKESELSIVITQQDAGTSPDSDPISKFVGSVSDPEPGTYNYEVQQHNNKTERSQHLDYMKVRNLNEVGEQAGLGDRLLPKINMELVDTFSGKKQWESIRLTSDKGEIYAEFVAHSRRGTLLGLPIGTRTEGSMKFHLGSVGNGSHDVCQKLSTLFKLMSQNVINKSDRVQVLDSELMRVLLNPTGLGTGIKLISAKNLDFVNNRWLLADISSAVFQNCRFRNCLLSDTDASGTKFIDCKAFKSGFNLSRSDNMVITGRHSFFHHTCAFAGHFGASVSGKFFACITRVTDARGSKFNYTASEPKGLMGKLVLPFKLPINAVRFFLPDTTSASRNLGTRNQGIRWNPEVMSRDNPEFVKMMGHPLIRKAPENVQSYDELANLAKSGRLNLLKDSEKAVIQDQLSERLKENTIDLDSAVVAKLNDGDLLVMRPAPATADGKKNTLVTRLIRDGRSWLEHQSESIPNIYLADSIGKLVALSTPASTSQPLPLQEMLEMAHESEQARKSIKALFAPLFGVLEAQQASGELTDKAASVIKKQFQELEEKELDQLYRRSEVVDEAAKGATLVNEQSFQYLQLAEEILRLIHKSQNGTGEESASSTIGTLCRVLAKEAPDELTRVAINLAIGGHSAMAGATNYKFTKHGESIEDCSPLDIAKLAEIMERATEADSSLQTSILERVSKVNYFQSLINTRLVDEPNANNLSKIASQLHRLVYAEPSYLELPPDFNDQLAPKDNDEEQGKVTTQPSLAMRIQSAIRHSFSLNEDLDQLRHAFNALMPQRSFGTLKSSSEIDRAVTMKILPSTAIAAVKWTNDPSSGSDMDKHMVLIEIQRPAEATSDRIYFRKARWLQESSSKLIEEDSQLGPARRLEDPDAELESMSKEDFIKITDALLVSDINLVKMAVQEPTPVAENRALSIIPRDPNSSPAES